MSVFDYEDTIVKPRIFEDIDLVIDEDNILVIVSDSDKTEVVYDGVLVIREKDV